MAHHLPRSLYNGDCTFLFFGTTYNPSKGRYNAKIFHDFIDTIADAGFDVYLQNPNGQIPWYPSKITPNIVTGFKRNDRTFTLGHYPPTNDTDFTKATLETRIDGDMDFLGKYLDLVEDGVDWVAEISKACRHRKVTPWLSIRMNDLHGANNWEGSYFNSWMQKEKRFRLSGKHINPKDGLDRYNQGHSYAFAEVRDYYLAMMRELVFDYDYEGLELDWLRCPFAIEPTATAAECDVVTQWIGDIRAMTQKRAAQLGKNYPLGVRIPARLNQLRVNGLDVREWVRRGFIDYVTPSNFWQTSWDVPHDDLRRELGEHVTIYGCIEAAPNWLHAEDRKNNKNYFRMLPTSPELIRGNAAGKLALGTDGIEFFNFFCAEESHHNLGVARLTRYDALPGIADLNSLRGKPKHYMLSSMHGYYMFPALEYAEQVPQVIEPEWKKAFSISMCKEPTDRGLELVIQVVVEKKENLPDIGVSFNGCWPNFAGERTDELVLPTGNFTHHSPTNLALNFRFDVGLIEEGWNEVLLFNGSHQRATPEERHANSVCVLSLEFAVRGR